MPSPVTTPSQPATRAHDLPLVSIVTPTFNQAEYLAETIESVLAQDYPHIEYIVLDDGSTDATPDVLARYNGRIRWERQENMGQARTLNKGWDMSNGKYIGYLSSDDVIYPDAIKKLVAHLELNPVTVCVFPNCELIDEASRIIKANVCKPFKLDDVVVRQECHIGPGAVFRKTAFDHVGGWKHNLRLAPDREYWMRLSSQGKIEMLDEILAGYRMHKKSISYKDVTEETSNEYLDVLDNYFKTDAVPEDIQARKSEAYGHAYLLISRNRFRSGDIPRGIQLYRTACEHHQELQGIKYKYLIARTTISKPIRIMAAKIRSAFGI